MAPSAWRPDLPVIHNIGGDRRKRRVLWRGNPSRLVAVVSGQLATPPHTGVWQDSTEVLGQLNIYHRDSLFNIHGFKGPFS